MDLKHSLSCRVCHSLSFDMLLVMFWHFEVSVQICHSVTGVTVHGRCHILRGRQWLLRWFSSQIITPSMNRRSPLKCFNNAYIRLRSMVVNLKD